MGLFLDGNFMEHRCNKRENCKYYVEDFYRKYADMLDQFDFLVCEENCKYYSPKNEEVKQETSVEGNLFSDEQYVLK